MSKTELWERLGKTDPAHVKAFQRSGGFRGTAIKPMWSYRRMTEEFGPCGLGWGVNEPSFQVVPAGEEILVYCTVSIWHGERTNTVYGVGGDKVVAKFSSGARSDDEAFKKAYTDAVTNALKLIGVGADVHMGLFEDNKYVASVREEFAEQPDPPAKSSAALKREGEWERVSSEIANAMNDVSTFGQFEELKASYRAEAVKNGWNKAFLAALADLFAGYEKDVSAKVEADNDTVSEIQNQFAGARVVDERYQNPVMAGE